MVLEGIGIVSCSLSRRVLNIKCVVAYCIVQEWAKKRMLCVTCHDSNRSESWMGSPTRLQQGVVAICTFASMIHFLLVWSILVEIHLWCFPYACLRSSTCRFAHLRSTITIDHHSSFQRNVIPTTSYFSFESTKTQRGAGCCAEESQGIWGYVYAPFFVYALTWLIN